MDKKFADEMRELIREALDMYKASTTSPRVAEVWGCKNVGDFMCGFFVGDMVATLRGAFSLRYKKMPTAEEQGEMVRIVEEYSNEIEGFFARFNRS